MGISCLFAPQLVGDPPAGDASRKGGEIKGAGKLEEHSGRLRHGIRQSRKLAEHVPEGIGACTVFVIPRGVDKEKVVRANHPAGKLVFNGSGVHRHPLLNPKRPRISPSQLRPVGIALHRLHLRTRQPESDSISPTTTAGVPHPSPEGLHELGHSIRVPPWGEGKPPHLVELGQPRRCTPPAPHVSAKVARDRWQTPPGLEEHFDLQHRSPKRQPVRPVPSQRRRFRRHRSLVAAEKQAQDCVGQLGRALVHTEGAPFPRLKRGWHHGLQCVRHAQRLGHPIIFGQQHAAKTILDGRQLRFSHRLRSREATLQRLPTGEGMPHRFRTAGGLPQPLDEGSQRGLQRYMRGHCSQTPTQGEHGRGSRCGGYTRHSSALPHRASFITALTHRVSAFMPRSSAAPALLVVCATVVFGTQSAWNAQRMAPCWGQDLAFFHQLVHSAAKGGPWSTPLLLEPRGFFEMVHTHLVLPLIVAAYAVLPRQEVLLYAQAAFTCLALWPAWRLGEAVAPRGGGWLAALSLVVFGPFQGLATADFRPSALFLPGLLGVLSAAWRGERWAVVGWAAVAILGRQEAVYLLGTVALTLAFLPWGPLSGRSLLEKWRSGLRPVAALLLAITCLCALAFFVWAKPAMFFHFDPLQRPAAAALSPDHLADRLTFLTTLGRSGAVLGLLAPTALIPLLPISREMLEMGREWGPVVGPAAHYAAFWLPFACGAWIAGAGARLGRAGLTVVVVLNASSLPWPGWRKGPVHLAEVAQHIPAEAPVAADYDTIHRLAGRPVLWNTAQLRMNEHDRPRGWVGDWPVPVAAVDYIIARADDPIQKELTEWETVATIEAHRIWRRPSSLPPVESPYGVDPASLVRPRARPRPQR